jgi:uncharacterized protein YfaS (alpha-2-macroglobulin family)
VVDVATDVVVVGEPVINVATPSLTRGAAAESTGAGFQPNETVTVVAITADGTAVEVGTATADRQGGFRTNVTLPQDLPAGEYTLRALGQRGSQSRTARVIRLP